MEHPVSPTTHDEETDRVTEHKTSEQEQPRDNPGAQEGSGRQHPSGTGPGYKAPKKRGSAGGKTGGKRDKHQGGDGSP